jgi:hypothetical protein
MSETATTRQPLQRPAEILLNIIVTLLTPMFFEAAGGDLTFARQAAAETINAYRADTKSDLITIAKIIAFGLATLGALSLSMADDLSITMMLRLHASANASDRAEHRNRLALKQSRQQHPAPPRPEPVIDHAALTAAVTETQKRTAENLAKFAPPAAAVPPAAPSETSNEKHYQATWAACTAAIAAETAASLPTLPPNERHSAAIWVEALNSAAQSFLTEGLPPRPKPGDLAAVMRGA